MDYRERCGKALIGTTSDVVPSRHAKSPILGSIRLGIRPIVLPHLALLVGTLLVGTLLVGTLIACAAGAIEARTSHPLVAVRADHMVLDLAMHRGQLLVATQSGRVDVYDRVTGELRGPLFVENSPAEGGLAPTVRSLAIAPSGAELAVVTADGRLRRFKLGLESESGGALLVGENEIPGLMLAQYLDDRRILLADMRGEIALLDIETNIEIHRRQLDYDPIFAFELSPDRSQLAVAFRSSRVQILDPETGETRKLLKGHLDSVFGLTWLNNHELATAGKDKRLLTWDLRESDPEPRLLYRGDHFITAVGFDRIGERVALPLDGFDIGLFKLSDQQIEHRLSGHTAPIQKLLFIDEGRTLISGGHDARVFVWNLEHDLEQK